MANLTDGRDQTPDPVQPKSGAPSAAAEGHGFKVPRSLSDVIVEVFEALLRLWRNPDARKILKNPWTYTVIAAIVAGLAWIGPQPFEALLRLRQGDPDFSNVNGIPFRKQYLESVRAAVQNEKAYFIDSVTMEYDIDVPEQTDPKRPIWNISWRNTYTITALEEIRPNGPNETVFEETFGTVASEKTGWAGTEDQEPMPPNQGAMPRLSPIQDFYVKLDMKKGEKKTFTTGIDLVRDLRKDKEPEAYDGRTLAESEDYIAYPNLADYVGDVLIIVRSRSLAVQPAWGEPAFTSHIKRGACLHSLPNPEFPGPNPSLQVRFKPSSKDSKDNGWNTISKEWSNVPPCQLVGFFYKWPPASTGAASP
jgi:hypothetical protein